MTRIAGIGAGGLTPGRPKATNGAAAPDRFNVAGNDPAPAVQENQPAQNVALAGMLALQEAETGTVQDKTARRHGFALLEALSQLQKALLSGLGDGETAVTSLNRLANEMPEAADPKLAGVLDAIRLRVKIELLRRGLESL